MIGIDQVADTLKHFQSEQQHAGDVLERYSSARVSNTGLNLEVTIHTRLFNLTNPPALETLLHVAAVKVVEGSPLAAPVDDNAVTVIVCRATCEPNDWAAVVRQHDAGEQFLTDSLFAGDVVQLYSVPVTVPAQ